MTDAEGIARAIRAMSSAPEGERVRAYNEMSAALGDLVVDIARDPALSPRLIPATDIRGNPWNPNKVADPELDLLEDSMRADGITMPCVVARADGTPWQIVDGFHRHLVAVGRLGRSHIPCSVIAGPEGNRMASTIRHNRARGKHQVDLMAAIVRMLLDRGWDDAAISAHLGMSVEEILRLRQMTGAARLLAGDRYSQCWENDP